MWNDLKPFLVLGIALGGVFAMSGVGLVVLYRATGVLNLAYGAVGAMGALISWELLDNGFSPWLAYPACVLFGGVLPLLYGYVVGPSLAGREPLIKTTATLGLLVILLGVMQLRYGHTAHSITLPTSHWNYEVVGVRVSMTQIIGVVFPVIVTTATAIFLRSTKVGTAMRALANDRDITAMLGVPVRRVEAAAWFGSGVLCGVSGLLLANLVSLDIATLSFLVVPALAAALIGQLHSLPITLGAGFVIGIVQSSLNTFSGTRKLFGLELAPYRSLTPFVLAIVALLFARQRVQART